jgi:glycerol-3-phosphate dehydrogenase
MHRPQSLLTSSAPDAVVLSRDLGRLARGSYDVLVIGGGISGACIAWDAAARGLKVALVDRGDFGGATSANSLKTIHGGLRYLQDGNLRLVRQMAAERKAWLRIAPHLVHPLPVLLPTFENDVRRSRWTLGAAARLNDLLSIDRNTGLPPTQSLPGSRILSRADCLAVLPALGATGLSGGLVWHDAQVYNTERLTLAILQSAAYRGAQVTNYTRATALMRAGQRVTGLRLRDESTGADLTVAAQVVINATGPWAAELLNDATGLEAPLGNVPSLAVNLVTRQLWPDYAVALPSDEFEAGGVRRSQILFVVPWRGYSLVGTRHAAISAGHPRATVAQDLAGSLLRQINHAYPALALRPEDVHLVHAGLLPAAPEYADVRLIRESQLVDHAKSDGVAGLITVIGVKYTTARLTAARVVDLVLRKLERPVTSSPTDHLSLYGGQCAAADEQPAKGAGQVPTASLSALRRNHGSAYRRVLQYVEADPTWGRPLGASTTTVRAEVIHAVRAEMALRLSDLVVRRTELGSAGRPDEQAVAEAAAIMADELGWDGPRLQREQAEVWDYYAARQIVTDHTAVSV